MTLGRLFMDVYPGSKISSSGWFNIDCVFCPDGDTDKHLGLHFVAKTYNCWKCQVHGKLSDLIKKMGIDVSAVNFCTSTRSRNEVKQTHASISLPNEFIPLALMRYGHTHIENVGLTYIGKRIGFKIALKLGVGFCVAGYYSYRVIIPNYDYDELTGTVSLNYFIARAAHKDYKPKVLNPIGAKNAIFNWSVADRYSEIYIMEGVFGAITLYPKAVALYGKNINDYQLHRIISSSAKIVNIVLDGGAEDAAYGLADKILALTNKFKIRVVELVGKSQPDDYTPELLIQIIKNTLYYTGIRV